MGAPATFLLGGAVLNAVPAPTDFGYFALQHWILVNQAILPSWQAYWINFIGYYGLAATWWMGLFLLVVNIPWQNISRVFLIIGLASAGAVVGLVAYLSQGQALPGVSGLGLGYMIVFGTVAAVVGLSSAIVYEYRIGAVAL